MLQEYKNVIVRLSPPPHARALSNMTIDTYSFLVYYNFAKSFIVYYMFIFK